MSSRIELLPCPFCGGKAEINRFGNFLQSTQYECTDCGCLLETGEEFNHGTQWNTRAMNADKDRLQLAIKALCDLNQVLDDIWDIDYHSDESGLKAESLASKGQEIIVAALSQLKDEPKGRE